MIAMKNWIDTPTCRRPATSDEVLRIIADMIRLAHREEVAAEVGQPEYPTRETTLDDVLFHLDLDDIKWPKAANLFREWFDFECTDEEFEPFLKKPAKVQLVDLCDFIAPKALIDVIEPARIMRMISWEAGLFRTIRSALQRRGVSVDNLRPSSPMSPLLCQNRQIFWQELTKIAPGRLPSDWKETYAAPVAFAGSIVTMGGCLGPALFFCGVVWLLLSRAVPSMHSGPWAFILLMSGGLLTLLSWLTWLVAVRFQPRQVQIGELVTFHDLCHALAVHFRREGNHDR